MQEYGLVHFDAAKKELALASSIDEVKKIRDQAEAIRQYIRQQKGSFEMQNQAAEIKLRAERRAGEMLKGNPEIKPGGDRKSSFHDVRMKLSDLGLTEIQSHRWQLEADIPEGRFEQFIAETKAAAEELTSRAALSIATKIKNEAKKEPTSDDYIPAGIFDVIIVDPPWPYGTKYDSRGAFGRIASPYTEMPIEDIMIMDIPAASNCILWLWTTNRFMHDAYHILESWAFTPKTILTWFKMRTGVGYWLRGDTEHCILAIRGKPPITHKAQSTALISKATEHSKKPNEFYLLVESLCPGKKLEMFGRADREGWTVHGNQRNNNL